jgi:hypothetical protein
MRWWGVSTAGLRWVDVVESSGEDGAGEAGERSLSSSESEIESDCEEERGLDSRGIASRNMVYCFLTDWWECQGKWMRNGFVESE